MYSLIKFFPYSVRAGLVEKKYIISMSLHYYGLDHVLTRKSSGQSSKSSCLRFHMAKCLDVFLRACKSCEYVVAVVFSFFFILFTLVLFFIVKPDLCKRIFGPNLYLVKFEH